MEPVNPVQIGDVTVGGGAPLVLIAGPCVIESETHALGLAVAIRDIAARAGVPFIFKASYDKANRTSLTSYRGPGLAEGLQILARVKRTAGVKILTDIHEPSQAAAAAEVADVLQIPAFLSRQTDLLVAAAKTGCAVNIKKGQFLAPRDMRHPIAKVTGSGNRRVLVTERGACFGYNNLVVDMRSLAIMRDFGWPVVFDATHSVQLPGGLGAASGGQAQFIEMWTLNLMDCNKQTVATSKADFYDVSGKIVSRGLMNIGPTPVEPKSIQAMAAEIVCH